MIDLDLLESAVKKVWYTRTEEEDAVHSHVISELGILDIITRLRQAEKDAARYRSANERAESLISYIDCEVSELVKNDYSRYCELDGIATETGYYLKAMKCEQ